MSKTLDEVLDNLAYEMGPHADEFKPVQVSAAKQAILQWVNDEVVGNDSHIHDGAAGDEATWEAAQNAKNEKQRAILKQHGWKE